MKKYQNCTWTTKYGLLGILYWIFYHGIYLSNFTGKELLFDGGNSSEAESFYLRICVCYYILKNIIALTGLSLLKRYMFHGQSFLIIIIVELILFSLAYVLFTYSVLWTIELFLLLDHCHTPICSRIFSLFLANIFLPFPHVFLTCQFFSSSFCLENCLSVKPTQGDYRTASFLTHHLP